MYLPTGNPHTSDEVLMHLGNYSSGRFRTEKGVRQSCTLSPLLFNIYREFVMCKTLENWAGGVSASEAKLNNLRYADHTVLLANDKEELMKDLKEKSLNYGQEIDNGNTKVVIVDRQRFILDQM